jgi:hypothetical protein
LEKITCCQFDPGGYYAAEGGNTMLGIDESLKKQLQETNKKLIAKYKSAAGPSRDELRRLIDGQVGRIRPLRKMSPTELQAWIQGKSIVAVDGSVNQIGGTFPHYLAIIQAVAKGTRAGEVIIRSEIYAPLLENAAADRDSTGEPDREGRIRTRKMARLEMEAAKEAIAAFNPRLVMMDGSLIHYRIEDAAAWSELSAFAAASGTLLVGVTEEIGTQIVSTALREALPENMRDFHDRELLFGLLEYGESLEIETGKGREAAGLRTCFLRPSADPQAVGVDILKGQVAEMPDAADFLFTLTPAAGRGVPVWLDIIDSEVRLTDTMVEGLVDAYLDADLKQRLFVPKRNSRIF